MAYVLCGLIGYFLGTINLAYLIAHYKGFDIRTLGSHNAGASNAVITMGWKIGSCVALCDIGKAAAAILLAKLLFPQVALAGVTAGVCCVVGHIFPFYLKFHGGKGFAAYLGMVLALSWKYFLIVVVAVALITLITNYIALGTFFTVLSFPVYLYFFGNGGWLMPVIAACASCLILYKHIPNMIRMAKGEEIGLRQVNKNP